ncbi:hypothetical protein IAE22_28945, partial [Bacillus sp. S34]|nr:hypothetical protein [Bacillus sp. S34]
MIEREQAWQKWSDARPDDDEVDPVSFTAGYDAGHASAEAKYAPALSAAGAERDLARGNELAIAAISAAYRTYRDTRD